MRKQDNRFHRFGDSASGDELVAPGFGLQGQESSTEVLSQIELARPVWYSVGGSHSECDNGMEAGMGLVDTGSHIGASGAPCHTL